MMCGVKTTAAIVVLGCLAGCQDAPTAFKMARIAVYSPLLASQFYPCIEARWPGRSGEVEATYRSQLGNIMTGMDAEIEPSGHTRRRAVTVVFLCSEDPYGERAFARCEFGGTSPRIYVGGILLYLKNNNLDASPEMIGTLLANVVAHELGHSVGLKHRSDPGHVMSVPHPITEFWQPQKW